MALLLLSKIFLYKCVQVLLVKNKLKIKVLPEALKSEFKLNIADIKLAEGVF